MSIIFRTTDNTRWGTGQGSDLSAEQIDLNFWTLYSAVLALQDHQQVIADIDFITATGDQLYVHLTDHRVVGPIKLPTSQWNYRSGGWRPATAYAAFDVFSFNGSLYLVLVAHTSGATFSEHANDGNGHEFYGLLIATPDNALPNDGTPGQRLTKKTVSPFATEWRDERVRLVSFCLGKPDPNELMFQYPVADHMELPAGLTDSIAYAASDTLSAVSWTLRKNGSSIGSIDFGGPSPQTVTVTFPATVSFVPGDIITFNAPSIPDVQQANVSFVFLATLTA